MRALPNILSSLILVGALAGCVVYGGHEGRSYGYSGGYGYNGGSDYHGDYGDSSGTWHRPYNGW